MVSINILVYKQHEVYRMCIYLFSITDLSHPKIPTKH